MSDVVGRCGSFWYCLPDGLGYIEFPPRILEHFVSFQQKQPHDKEAGGQLFWEYSPEGHRRVALVTGPRPTDQRSRTRYKADHRQEQIEINRNYDRGLYLLGDWHTHPEAIARPSAADIEAIQDIYRGSRNPGPGLLLVIVGTRPLYEGLSVSWCSQALTELTRVEKKLPGLGP
ncbi:Mov34/MPN/PAD-1 family protein [Marinobacter nauticus]|uniref:Mov34/MPN/PAD-1 family protein n=1 Tax=Marinobacter nauticus TaxID=2743 RepID=UPI003512F938